MATLDVTEKVNVLVDAIGWEGFCEELIGRSSVGKGARASGRVPFFFGFFGTALRAA